MSKLKLTLGVVAIAFITLTAVSCKDNKKEKMNEESHSEMGHDNSDGHHDNDSSEMNHDDMGESNEMMHSNTQDSGVSQVVSDYMALKDALVETNKDAAAKAGNKLNNTLSTFDVSSYTSEQQDELKDILEDAKEQAEHIGKSEMDHQREHFKTLSKDMIDMVAITGTTTTLYQQFCPMYDKGSAWLSMSKDVKNPYYGEKMLTCGKVQKEIN
jgi:hypothetical protein